MERHQGEEDTVCLSDFALYVNLYVLFRLAQSAVQPVVQAGSSKNKGRVGVYTASTGASGQGGLWLAG